MSDEPEETSGTDKLIAHVGIVKSDVGKDITVDVRQWTDPKGKEYPPNVRVNRLGEKKGEVKIKAMGSLKSVAEVEGLAKLLPAAAAALKKALK